MIRRRLLSAATAFVFAFTAAACGGGGEQPADDAGTTGGEQPAAGQQQAPAGQQGGQQAAAGQLSTPEWMQVDQANQTVTLDIVAGSSNANNSWNYNGYHSGNATIVVPEGFEITINFENADQVNPHSLGIDTRVGNYPAVFQQTQLAFEGAVTEGATEMAAATQPGQSETITFTAAKAGEYAMVCYVPAHANQGMWILFNVSADGQAGFREGG